MIMKYTTKKMEKIHNQNKMTWTFTKIKIWSQNVTTITFNRQIQYNKNTNNLRRNLLEQMEIIRLNETCRYRKTLCKCQFPKWNVILTRVLNKKYDIKSGKNQPIRNNSINTVLLNTRFLKMWTAIRYISKSDDDNNTNNYNSAVKINRKTLIIPSKTQHLLRITTYFIIMHYLQKIYYVNLIFVIVLRPYLL